MQFKINGKDTKIYIDGIEIKNIQELNYSSDAFLDYTDKYAFNRRLHIDITYFTESGKVSLAFDSPIMDFVDEQDVRHLHFYGVFAPLMPDKFTTLTGWHLAYLDYKNMLPKRYVLKEDHAIFNTKQAKAFHRGWLMSARAIEESKIGKSRYKK